MSVIEYVTQISAECRERMSEHKIVKTEPNRYVFRHPSRSSWLIEFTVDRNALIVRGDLSYAIYQVTQLQTIEFWMDTDWHYFMSKCVASPKGERFQSWCGELALNCAKELLGEGGMDGMDDGWGDEIFDMRDELRRILHDSDIDMDHKESIMAAGVAPDSHLIAQHTALKMMREQLVQSGG